ncbi:MAG TPA: DNA mismatch repair endonuclease MutL [Candidatus Sulfotelmatobacter sp.]|jgi:DNA mismatch repair protein MutL|nr:DNA mismatch repair endonuclease MutL [Candidatus Sulfotelmatobacter sp.]
MPRIHVLDDHLINRIAAGEVVERPASVVKELVENSLDASARAIDVALEDGGRRRIVVSDDGQGMDRDDALLALERHATSKLAAFEDLDAIATLGFRGEALPSIAAVSRFRLRTVPGAGAGTEIEVRAGRIGAVREIAGAHGTSVEVGSLFVNVPARRKFLKAAPTELSHAVRTVGQYAIAHPEVRFRLTHDGRGLLDAPPARDLAERVAQIHGREPASKLIPFDARSGGVAVRGFAGRPVDASPRRDTQHLFVNGRAVTDRVLSHAIVEAYGNTAPRGSFPAIILFVELDPAQVDVNVHPRKSEVRFARASQVHDAVRDAVASALASTLAVPRLAELRPEPAAWSAPASTVAALGRALEHFDAGEPSRAYRATAAPPVAAAVPRGLLDPDSPAAAQGRRATPLAQYRESYIVAQDAEGILLVDQHVAHERVLFERYLAAAETDDVPVQRLLFPVTVELRSDEMIVAEAEIEEFRRLGVVYEPFGGHTIRIDAVPAFAKEVAPDRLLRGLLGEAGKTRSAATGVAELRRVLVTSASCQAAIKVNYALTREGMQQLLDDLFLTQNPTTCPHGRPILFRLTLEEIERAFRRR